MCSFGKPPICTCGFELYYLASLSVFISSFRNLFKLSFSFQHKTRQATFDAFGWYNLYLLRFVFRTFLIVPIQFRTLKDSLNSPDARQWLSEIQSNSFLKLFSGIWRNNVWSELPSDGSESFFQHLESRKPQVRRGRWKRRVIS